MNSALTALRHFLDMDSGCFGVILLSSVISIYRIKFNVSILSNIFLATGIFSSALIYQEKSLGVFFVLGTVYSYCLFLRLMLKMGKIRQERIWPLSCAMICCVVLVFSILRGESILTLAAFFNGTSFVWLYLDMWLILRLIAYLFEFGSGKIQDLNFRSFLIWICFPHCLFGPLVRYSNFISQCHENNKGLQKTKIDFIEILFGLSMGLGQMVLGKCIHDFNAFIINLNGNTINLWEKPLGVFFVGPWEFYLKSAGYFKVMETLACIFGMKLPQSFTCPFTKTDISKFWGSWNMTVTHFFRDFVFFNRWGMGKINVYLNALLVFLLVGLWHGSNAYWLLWGLYHGCGYSIYLGWRARANSRDKSKKSQMAWQLSGWFLTYVFVCSAWAVPNQILKRF